jgi:hypothetical protein
MSQGAKLRSPRKKLKPTKSASSASSASSAEHLRPRLEAARLELRALYRSLDRMRLAQDVPAGLRRLQELDADFAEALWVLDQPRGRFNVSAMVDDTLASLSRLAPTRAAFLASFDAATRAALEDRAQATLTVLSPTDAYLEIPGRDPDARRSRS